MFECIYVGVHKLVDWLMYISHCLNLVFSFQMVLV